MALLTVYVLVSILLLHYLLLWNISFIKDTLFWFFGFALVTFFNINKAKDVDYFKTIFKESFKWTLLIEFIVSFYTFSLTTELIMFPIIIVVAGTQAFSKADKKNEKVTSLLTNILALIGTTYFLYALFETFNKYNRLLTLNTLNSFLLPLLLTILSLPFFYFVALYMHYEELFIRVDFMTNDNKLKKRMKREIFIAAHVNLNRLTMIKQKLNKFDLYHSTDIKQYLKNIL